MGFIHPVDTAGMKRYSNVKNPGDGKGMATDPYNHIIQTAGIESISSEVSDTTS